MIRIAQASSSETFSKFGTPPNQRRTGGNPWGNMDGELNIAGYHSGFERVFRCIDPKIADKAATYAEHAVANGQYVGYGQNWIDDKYPMCGLFDAMMQLSDPDPLNVRSLVNCTCATLIGACYYFAGVYEPKFRLLNTMEQEKILLDTGMFVEINDQELVQSGLGVKRGDIVHRVGHTAMVLDDDPNNLTTPYRTANCYMCNMRSGAGTQYPVIEELYCDEVVFYISTATNGWGQVEHNGKIGYISGKYLEPLPTADVIGDCWLRTEAGKISHSTEIIVMPQGSHPSVTGKVQRVLLTTWRECVYAHHIGWASGKFVKLTQS